MKKLALLSLFAVLCLTVAANAATPYFYGGDFNANDPNANGLANETDGTITGSPYGAATFQNFTASGAITVTGLFTNNLNNNGAPANGYWEIRKGVSEGNGGTLVASGTGAMTDTNTGRSGFGYTETHNEIDGLNVSLAAGQYWFAAVPNTPNGGGRDFNSNTFGVNSIGTQ